MTKIFKREIHLPVNSSAAFEWHSRDGAFERLTPPWEPAQVVFKEGGIFNGGKVVLKIKIGFIHLTWNALHQNYVSGKQFEDVLVPNLTSPFALWRHTHRFIDAPQASGNNAQSLLQDEVEYALPLHTLAKFVAQPFVERKLNRMFRYRHFVTLHDTAFHGQFSKKKLRFLVTGATGMVGSALVPFLTTGGHEVVRIVRSRKNAIGTDIVWNLSSASQVPSEQLEGFDVVVHLAGENIAGGRWTAERKHAILESRKEGTKVLCQALSKLKNPPKTIVSASGIGYFGNRGDEVLTDASQPGSDFLAHVASDWERGLAPAREAGIRAVSLRFGMVLAAQGGVLKQLLLPFKMGLGGPVGSGKQFMSWVALEDVLRAILFSSSEAQLNGSYNCVAPQALRNTEFAQTLGRVLNRPAVVPLPAFAVKIALGEMGEQLLLAGQNAKPDGLQAAGFQFLFPELESALRHVLGH